MSQSTAPSVSWLAAQIAEHGPAPVNEPVGGILASASLPPSLEAGVKCLCGVALGSFDDLPVHIASALVSAGVVVESQRTWITGYEEVAALLETLSPSDLVAVVSSGPDSGGALYSAEGPYGAIKLDGKPLKHFVGLFSIALIRRGLWDDPKVYAVSRSDDSGDIWIRASDADNFWQQLDDPSHVLTSAELEALGDFVTHAVRKAAS